MSSNDPKFSAVYYPGATIDNWRQLKMMCLYFDEVSILSPVEIINKKAYIEPSRTKDRAESESAHEYARRRTREIHDFLVSIRLLREEGLIKVVSPTELWRHSGMIASLVEEDLRDEDFCEIARRCSAGYLRVARIKWLTVVAGLDMMGQVSNPWFHDNIDLSTELRRCWG